MFILHFRSPTFVNFIAKCLTKDYETRPAAADLLSVCTMHPDSWKWGNHWLCLAFSLQVVFGTWSKDNPARACSAISALSFSGRRLVLFLCCFSMLMCCFNSWSSCGRKRGAAPKWIRYDLIVSYLKMMLIVCVYTVTAQGQQPVTMKKTQKRNPRVGGLVTGNQAVAGRWINVIIL